MVKSPPRIPKMQQLTPRSKIMKKIPKLTRRRRPFSGSPSPSPSPSPTPPPSSTATCTLTPCSLSFSPSPPLPPLSPSSQLLLKRAASDPVFLQSHSSTPETASASKKVKKKLNDDSSPSELSVSPTLEGFLPPPLPPSPSPEFLRRTVSCPVPATSLSSSTGNVKVSTCKEMKEETHKVSMSEEWFMLECNCECGKDFKLLVNKADKKCHKLV